MLYAAKPIVILQAAPLTPYAGINKTDVSITNIEQKSAMFLSARSLPVMFKMTATEPVKMLMN